MGSANDAIKASEINRLQFMVDNLGKEVAMKFAVQGLSVYYRALRTPYGSAYRRELINSLIIYRWFKRGILCLEAQK